MARTNIKVFDEGYRNIMSDDDYNLSLQRTRGVTPGIADPLMHNKLYRQVSIMSTALAQYIVDQNYDCLDTDLPEIAANIKNATIKTMLDRLAEGNFTIGDGVTVTGDLKINQKLVADTIEVTKNITIAGKEPLDASALQKIQDQIIAPNQRIYWDILNGNDNNDGKTELTPIKSSNKLLQLLNKQVPTVEICLVCYKKTDIPVYNMPVLDFYNALTTKLIITKYPWEYEGHTPIIKPSYGKITSYYAQNEQGISIAYYLWGNIFAGNIDEVQVKGVAIDCGTPIISSNGVNKLFYTSKLYLYGITNIIGDNSFSLMSIQNSNVTFECTLSAVDILENYTGWIIKLGTDTLSSEDPRKNINTKKAMQISSLNTTKGIVRGIAVSNVIPSKETSALGASGIDSGIALLYCNWL